MTDFSTNLKRLMAWHDLSNQDLARVLGATDASVSGWTTGKREPSGKYLKAIGDVFEVSVSKAFGDPVKFGLEVARPERFAVAEENIARVRREQMRAV